MGKVHASLFSGFGAGDLAAQWMGWDNAFWCEIDDFPRTVLSCWFPKSKAYGNIKETDFTPWRGKIDVLTGGFPCQPFSCAGQRKGQADDRYLWPEMLRAIREIRPTWVIGENVGGILSMVQPGSEITVESQASLFEKADKETLLDQDSVVETVCCDLEQEGYSVQPVVIPACAVEAPHRRDRIFFIAHRSDARTEGLQREGEDRVYKSESVTDPDGKRCDNQCDHRQERYVYHDQERNTQEDQPERAEQKCRACDNGSIANAHGKKLQTRLRAGRWTNKAEIRTRLDDGTERSCCLWFAPYANKLKGDLSGLCSSRLSQFETSGVRIDTDTYNKRFQKQHISGESEKSKFSSRVLHAQRRSWSSFPTQPPVCRGNDGLPFDVVCLAIPFNKWREGSVKGYGNAIVPQVMHEIFKAIEESEK